MRQDRKHRFTPRTLDAPDNEAAQPDARIVRVTGQASTAATGRLVGELESQSEQEGQDTLDKRLPIAKQAHVGRFIVEIDGDGTVLPRPCGCCGQCVTSRSSGLVGG